MLNAILKYIKKIVYSVQNTINKNNNRLYIDNYKYIYYEDIIFNRFGFCDNDDFRTKCQGKGH